MITHNNMKKTPSNHTTKSRKKHRRLIVFLLAFTVLFASYVIYGNTTVTVTRYDIHSERIPPGFDGFCIVQISDLHNGSNSVMTDSLLKKTAEAHPDVILITGDTIDRFDSDVDTAIKVVEKLIDFAPVYYVTGNHEARTGAYYKLAKLMRKIGVTELSDSFVNVRLNNDEIVIAGVNDPLTAHDTTASDKAIMEKRLSQLQYDPRFYFFFLSHRPELMDVYSSNNIDLVFTGHAHGGLIRLPLIGGLYAPHQGLMPKYTEGLYKQSFTSMIVSRGVGNSGRTFRINDNPELVVAVLHAG